MARVLSKNTVLDIISKNKSMSWGELVGHFILDKPKYYERLNQILTKLIGEKKINKSTKERSVEAAILANVFGDYNYPGIGELKYCVFTIANTVLEEKIT